MRNPLNASSSANGTVITAPSTRKIIQVFLAAAGETINAAKRSRFSDVCEAPSTTIQIKKTTAPIAGPTQSNPQPDAP